MSRGANTRWGKQLNMETVVGFIAVNADLFPVLDAYPVGCGALSAHLAYIGVKDMRLFGQIQARFLHVKQLLGSCFLVVGKGLLPGHPLRLQAQHKAYRPAVLPVIEGEGLLACQMEQQIALPHAAAQHYLDSIHAAGVVFRYAEDGL